MNWESLRAAKQPEIRQLASVQLSEVTPSIRSFAQSVTTHRQDVPVQTQPDLKQPLAAGAFILGIASPCGRMDRAHIGVLAALVPPQKTVIALDEISTPEEYAALQGKVDAVMVSNMLLDAADVDAALEDLTGR